MRSFIAIFSFYVAIAFVTGCGASVAGSPADDDSGAATTEDDASEVVDSGSPEKDAASAGDPCTKASDCPTYLCGTCKGMAAYCEGDNTCATEAETCAVISCDSPDAG